MTKKQHVTDIALLTNCTMSANYEPLVDITNAPEVQTMQELCDWWVAAIQLARKSQPKGLHTPGALYSGVSFDTVAAIAQIIGHKNIFVVNRGAGLVRLDHKMVPYNFTHDKDDPLSAWNKVVGEKFIPAIWWGLVNHGLYGLSTPITEYLSGYKYIVTALPQGFVRLIAPDLELLGDMNNRLLMPMPQSGITSIPRTIRSACIPYSKAYTRDLTYNKFSKTQKVAEKFITVGLESGNLMKHANALRDAQNALEEIPAAEIGYPQLFKENPELVTSGSAEAAYRRAKMKGLRIGSQAKFTGAWLGSQGVQEIEITTEEFSTATSALQAIMAEGIGQAHSTDEELLKQIGVFIAVVKGEDATLPFTPKNIASWGKIVYPSENTKKPHSISKSAKVSSILRNYTDYLGLEQITVGTTKAYRIKR